MRYADNFVDFKEKGNYNKGNDKKTDKEKASPIEMLYQLLTMLPAWLRVRGRALPDTTLKATDFLSYYYKGWVVRSQ